MRKPLFACSNISSLSFDSYSSDREQGGDKEGDNTDGTDHESADGEGVRDADIVGDKSGSH